MRKNKLESGDAAELGLSRTQNEIKPVVYIRYICERCDNEESLPDGAYPVCGRCNFTHVMVEKK